MVPANNILWLDLQGHHRDYSNIRLSYLQIRSSGTRVCDLREPRAGDLKETIFIIDGKKTFER